MKPLNSWFLSWTYLTGTIQSVQRHLNFKNSTFVSDFQRCSAHWRSSKFMRALICFGIHQYFIRSASFSFRLLSTQRSPRNTMSGGSVVLCAQPLADWQRKGELASLESGTSVRVSRISYLSETLWEEAGTSWCFHLLNLPHLYSYYCQIIPMARSILEEENTHQDPWVVQTQALAPGPCCLLYLFYLNQ